MPQIYQNESTASRRELNWTAQSTAGTFLATTSTWFWDLWHRKPGASWTQLVSSDPIRTTTVPTATATPATASSLVVGDLVLIFLWTSHTAVPTHTIQSNYTEILTVQDSDGATSGRLSVAYHNPSGGDAGTTLSGVQTFTPYTVSAGTSYAGILVLKKGYWTVTGIQSASTSDTGATAPDAPSVTLNQKKMVIIASAWRMSSAATVTVTAPANYTKQWDISGSVAAELACATRLFKTAVAAAENPATWVDDVTPDSSASVTIAITMTPLTQENFSYDDTNAPGDVKYTGLTAALVDTLGQNRFRATNTGSTTDCVQRDPLIDVVPAAGDATAAAQTTAQTDLTTLIGRLTAARAGYLDNLSAGAVAQNSDIATLLTRLSSARAGYLDNLSAGAVAQAATALSTAQWTNTRAGYLDNLSGGAVALNSDIATLLSRLSALRAGYLDNLSGGAVALNSDMTTVLSRLSAARAGYLDNLNVGGLVASSAEATAIQNNTRVVRVVPETIERPDAGTVTYRIELLLYDTVGNMEAPDSAPTIALVNQAGTDRSSRLDSTTMALVSTGRYRAIYTADVADTLEQLVWAFSVVEGGATRIYGNSSLIVDTSAVDFTSADRTKLNSIDARLPASLTGGRMDSSVGAYQSGMVPLQPTVAGRTLDVSVGGEGGIDWANIGSPTTVVALSGTTVKDATDTLHPTVAGRTLDVTATGAGGVDWGNVENQGTVVDLAETTIKTMHDLATGSSSGGASGSSLLGIGRWKKAEALAAKRRVLIEARYSDGTLADPRIVFDVDADEILADPSTGERVHAAGILANVSEPLTADDFDFTTTHADDLVNATAHGRKTGQGPFRLTTTGVLPVGYLAGTNYWWIWKSADTGQWASSLANALAGTAVAITTDGTGTHTAVDVPGTTQSLVDGEWMYEADAGEIDIIGNYFAVTLQHEATVITITDLSPGTGDDMIITGAGFLPRHVGRTITIADAVNVEDNGTFTITAVSLDGTEATVTNAGSIEEGGVSLAGTLNDDIPAVTVSVDLYELEIEMDSGMGGKPWGDIHRGNTAIIAGRANGFTTGLVNWICPFTGKTRWTHTIVPDGRSVATEGDLA